MMQFPSKPRLSTVVGAILAAAASGPALAQSSTAASPNRIEVTGSRILRVDAETPSPVQVITSADLQKSSYTTLAEVLQNLTANGQGTLSQGFSQAFASGASGISLRGLTTSATLVLIDGHRMAPYPLSDDAQRSFVDVSNLPFDAVERIEILKDGASATYGSDAIAGVVNIILKKSFTGTRVALEGGVATEGGGKRVHGSVIRGFGDYELDGYTAYGSLEYRQQDRITYTQRAGKGLWQNLDWAGYSGINRTPGVITPNNPQPPTLSPYLTNPAASFSGDPTSSYFYGGACPSYAALAAGSCAYQNPLAQISPRTENLNVIGSFSKNLGGGFRLDLKASLFDSKAEQYPAGFVQTFPSSLTPIVGVSAGVPPRIVTPTIDSITVPATYPGNPFGVPAVVNGVIPGAPLPHTTTDSKATRLVADLAGTLGDWDVGAALGYTHIATRQTVYGLLNVPALNAALNRATNPYKVAGGNTTADVETLFPTSAVDDISTLSFVEGHASRSIMALPGGEIGFSGGFAFIERKLDSPAPPLIAQGLVGGNNAFVAGRQTDTALYAELVAPVLKTLELDAALRYDHFNNAGNATTPKLGFKWTPTKSFGLRGTAALGFRAPNAAENGQAGTAFLVGSTFDPALCPGGDTNHQGNVVAYCSFTPVTLQGANPQLQAEKSHSATLGVILEPIPGWSTTIDLYQIEISNQVVTPQYDIANAVRGMPIQSLCSDGSGGTTTCTTPTGPIVYIPVQYINANSTKTSGLELDTSYRFSLGEQGTLKAALDWSHIMSYVLTVGGSPYQLAGTHGPLVVGGDTGNPKDKVQASVTWEKGPFQLSGMVNWLSGFDLTDPSYGVNDCDGGASVGGYFPSGGVPSQFCKVKSFATVNASMRWKLDNHWTVHGSVVNVFNAQPPVDLATYGGGQLPYNPSMHLAGAIGRVINVGASYQF
jgi:iron complex outermembrane receptor protein